MIKRHELGITIKSKNNDCIFIGKIKNSDQDSSFSHMQSSASLPSDFGKKPKEKDNAGIAVEEETVSNKQNENEITQLGSTLLSIVSTTHDETVSDKQNEMEITQTGSTDSSVETATVSTAQEGTMSTRPMSTSQNIYVSAGTQKLQPYYKFYANSTGTKPWPKSDSSWPILNTEVEYKFLRVRGSTRNPFWISDNIDDGVINEETKNISLEKSNENNSFEYGITENDNITVYLRRNLPKLYFYCTTHPGMIGEFQIENSK